MIESSDDLLFFFEVDDFAETAAYVPLTGSPATIRGIFDAPQASRSITNFVDVTIPSPQFMCRTADTPNAAEGDGITIRSVGYTVRVVVTDGTGVTTLMLEKA